MDKKFLGIKISAILQFVFCVALAFIIWFIVQYVNMSSEEAEATANSFAYFSNLI